MKIETSTFEIFTLHSDTSLEGDLLPITLVLMIRTVQDQPQRIPYAALLHSGSNSSWIHDATPSIEVPRTCQTAAGLFTSNRHVRLADIILPDFGRTRTGDYQSAHVFSSDSI